MGKITLRKEKNLAGIKNWHLPAGLIAITFLLLMALPAQGQEKGTITGKIEGNPSRGSLKGATVVLVEFTIGADKKPKSREVGRQLAGDGGSYTFRNIPLNRKAVYRLGSKVEGQSISTEIFTFPASQTSLTMNLSLPEVKRDVSGLTMDQVLLAFEPTQGSVVVTEVFHFRNGTQSVLDTAQSPIRLPIPTKAENINVLRQDLASGGHDRVGSNIMLHGQFKQGPSTFAFNYTLPSWFGGVTLSKSYPFPIREVLVLSPEGKLAISGNQIQSLGSRKVQTATYDSWGFSGNPPGTVFSVSVKGIPIPQQVLLLSLVGFFLVMSGVVIWFLRVRMRAEG